jgi:hypothetical protein
MKKILLTSILTILSLSCSDKKQSTQTAFSIDNETKMEFLNEIFSDTTNLKLLPDQNIMISDFNFIPTLPKLIFKDDEYVNATYLEFLSHHLYEKDTLFIKEQIEKNKSFDLKQLSKFGYRVLNTRDLIKSGVTVDSLSTIVQNKNTDTDNIYNGLYILIDKPIFNKEMNRAYLSINTVNSGTDYVLKKANGNWEKEEIGYWVD